MEIIQKKRRIILFNILFLISLLCGFGLSSDACAEDDGGFSSDVSIQAGVQSVQSAHSVGGFQSNAATNNVGQRFDCSRCIRTCREQNKLKQRTSTANNTPLSIMQSHRITLAPVVRRGREFAGMGQHGTGQVDDPCPQQCTSLSVSMCQNQCYGVDGRKQQQCQMKCQNVPSQKSLCLKNCLYSGQTDSQQGRCGTLCQRAVCRGDG